MPNAMPAPSSSESEEETPGSSSANSEEGTPGASSTDSRSSGDVMEEAKRLIGTGNRHLVMRDVVSAVDMFQSACGMLASRYGDIAHECGEAYFLCGKSLLELARMESGVLGTALESIPEESEPEGDPTNSSIERENDIDDEEVEEDDDDDDDDDDEDADEEKGQIKEDDVGNLQLAWEMLEVAKVIYKRRESKDDQLMAAQTYLKLGEVSTESGNYPQALEDFQECLALQLKLLPPHSRLLAETHYHVATTYCYMDQYSQAVEHYNNSIEVLETRMAMLQELIDAAEGTDGATKEKNEVEELKLLLPDIREKVEDAKESQRTASVASQAIQETLRGASTSLAFPCVNSSPSSSAAFPTTSKSLAEAQPSSDSASSSKPVSNISHLVRRKTASIDSFEDGSPAKRAKCGPTDNGSTDSSPRKVQDGKSHKPASQSTSVEPSV